MVYIITPSLEHRVLVQLAVRLWKLDDNTSVEPNYDDDIKCYGKPGPREFWQEVEDGVEKFALPQLLKKKLLTFVVAVGKEIVRWERCFSHMTNLFYRQTKCSYLSKLCWTPQGTVDKKKTVEKIVRDVKVNIILRYKLACIFCLENDIRVLWKQLCETEMDADICKKYLKTDKLCLVSFWTNTMCGKLSEQEVIWGNSISNGLYCITDCPYAYVFRYAVIIDNEVAARYFLEKLTLAHKERILIHLTKLLAKKYMPPNEFLFVGYCIALRNDMFCFLFTMLNEEHQMEVLRDHAYLVLQCLLNWPWQDIFISTLQNMWPLISPRDYNLLLSCVSSECRDNFQDYDYKRLAYELWVTSPATYKTYVLNEHTDNMLILLTHLKDETYISWILEYLTDIEKEKLIFSISRHFACVWMLCHDDWDYLKILVPKCITSVEAVTKLRNKFNRHAKHHSCMWRPGLQICKKFACFLDDLWQSKELQTVVAAGKKHKKFR